MTFCLNLKALVGLELSTLKKDKRQKKKERKRKKTLQKPSTMFPQSLAKTEK